MKLAEALSVRKDLQNKIDQLEDRLKSIVKIQEGDEPDDAMLVLLRLLLSLRLFAMSIRSRALLNVCLWNFVALVLLVILMGNNPSYLSLGAVVVMIGLVQHFLQNYSALFRQSSFVVLMGMMLVVYLFELYMRVYGVA